jgi:hypothetical protein
MSKETSRAIVRAGYLLATEPFISKEETRYYLRGIHIEPHPRTGAILVATDGHTMSCIHNVDAIVSGESLIWKMAWKSMLSPSIKAFGQTRKFAAPGGHIYADMQKTLGKPDKLRLVFACSAAEVYNDRGIGDNIDPVAFYTHYGETPDTRIVIDGTFPEWRRVVPSCEEVEKFQPGWYQSKYIAKLAAFGLACGLESDNDSVNGGQMTMLTSDARAPTLARFNCMPEAFAVIMPMRGGEAPDASLGGMPPWYADRGDPPAEQAEPLKVSA